MLYRTYLFLDKDPVIDQMKTALDTSQMSIPAIAEKSGLAEGTLRNWFYGETLRPQFSSVQAFYRAIGWEMTPRPMETEELAGMVITDKAFAKAEAEAKKLREKRRERIMRHAKSAAIKRGRT